MWYKNIMDVLFPFFFLYACVQFLKIAFSVMFLSLFVEKRKKRSLLTHFDRSSLNFLQYKIFKHTYILIKPHLENMIPCFAYLSRCRADYFSGAMLHTIFIVKDNYVCNLNNLMLSLCILSAILALQCNDFLL